MQDIGAGKESIKTLKSHDNFLVEVRMHLEKDQDMLRSDVDDNMQLSQIIYKAVTELQRRKDQMVAMETDIQHYQAMQNEYENLKVRHAEEEMRNEELRAEVQDLQIRGKEALEDATQLTKSLDESEKRRVDLQGLVDEIMPKYESLLADHRSTREEAESKIARLEEQLNSALHREEVFKEKWRRTEEDCEKYRAEADARGLKVEYLETKLEEKYHVENLFSQLKTDYEDMRKEKQSEFEQAEARLVMKEEELKRASVERDEVLRENSRFERALEEKDLEVQELRSEIAERIAQYNNSQDEINKMESVVRQKQGRVEFFSNEISQLNKKILDFGELMEKLISENQRMKVRLEEYEKKDQYFRRQMAEVSKIRHDIQLKKHSEMDRLASTIDQFSGF